MPSEISSDTKSMIIALRPEGYSMPKIVEKLKQLGKSESLMTVRRVLQRQKLEQQGVIRKKKKLPPHQLPVACCKRNVSKVKKWISNPNPPTQKEIARRLKVCLQSVKRIFKKLGGVKRLKKRTTHYLTAKMAAQRLERGKKFLKKLSRRKLKLIFTMDEMLISTDDIKGQTDFYYKQQGVVVPESWRKLPKKNWPKQIMVAMGICWHGKSRIYIVPSDVKVNADAFIKFILKPMIEKDIPALYKEDAKEVVFHMDSAPAHTATKVTQWLKDRKVTYILKGEWMANSPDLAPLDYAINGIFKQILKSFLAENEKQLARIVRREWKKFPISVIRRALRRWKERVQAMIYNHGYQFEHIL